MSLSPNTSAGKKSNLIFILLIIIICAASYIRAYTLLKNEMIFDADEALVGLMAKHINQGRISPVFVYGQDYMGSFEAYTAAVFYSLFGESIIALKAAPAFYSVILIIFVFILFNMLFGFKIAAFVALFWTAPPYLPLYWSLSPTGGHIENLLFSFILLIFIYKYFETNRNIFLFVFSIIAGFAFWVNPFSIFIPLAFLILLVYSIIIKKDYNKIKYIGLALILFCAGCIPLISYNISNKFITFQKLAGFFLGISRGAYQSSDSIFILIFQKITGMISAVPSGIFRLSAGITSSAGNFYFDGFLFFCALIFFIIAGLKSKKYFFKTVALYALIVFALFCISARAADRPRYMLVFYPAITVALAFILKNSLSTLNLKIKIAVICIAALLIISNISVIFKTDKSQVNNSFFEKFRMTREFLDSRNIKYVYADMYIAYPLILLTDENIIASPYAGFYNEDRIPEYTELVKKNNSNVFIFFRDSYSSNSLVAALKSFGITFHKHTIADFDIFFGFSEYIDVDKLHLPKRFKKNKP